MANRGPVSAHHHKKLVISVKWNALIHTASHLYFRRPIPQLYSALRLCHQKFVVYFYARGRQEKKEETGESVHDMMIMVHGLGCYQRETNSAAVAFLREHKEEFFFDVKVRGWRNKRNCWCFCVVECWSLPGACRLDGGEESKKKVYVFPLVRLSATHNKGSWVGRERKHNIKYCYDICWEGRTINASWCVLIVSFVSLNGCSGDCSNARLFAEW